MNRTLLTSIGLSLSFVLVAGACGLDSDTGPTTGGAGGSGPTAGSSAGGNKTGGTGMTTGGMTTGGMTTGGMTTGGMTTGGMTTGGGGGTGGGAGDLKDTFAGTPNAFGFAWKDSFFLVACTEVQQHDCLTVQGACPDPGGEFEEKGSVFKEEFKMGGEAGKTYSVTIQVNGIVEGKYYNGGMRRNPNSDDLDNPAGTDSWHIGGNAIPSSYNVFKLSVFEADGTTPVQHYYLNSFPQSTGLESHRTVPISYKSTFDVPGQGVIKYLNQDSNCRAINNCGPGDNQSACPAARVVPNEPGLAVPTMYGGKPVAAMNVVNQAAQPFHAQMVHVTVTDVVLKP